MTKKLLNKKGTKHKNIKLTTRAKSTSHIQKASA